MAAELLTDHCVLAADLRDGHGHDPLLPDRQEGRHHRLSASRHAHTWPRPRLATPTLGMDAWRSMSFYCRSRESVQMFCVQLLFISLPSLENQPDSRRSF